MIVESKIVNRFRMGHGISRIPWSFLLARNNRGSMRGQTEPQISAVKPAKLALVVLALFVLAFAVLNSTATALAQTAPNAPPGFESDKAYRFVPENSPPGTNVGEPVAAGDADNDTLTYSISGTDANLFGIYTVSGQITVGAGTVLDYEARNSYAVTVTATDPSGAAGAIDVVITVTDVNLGSLYDLNDDGAIDRDEVISAVVDYFNDLITREETLEVIKLYFFGPPSPKELIDMLAWVEDGTTESEEWAVNHLNYLASQSLRGFRELMRKPWIKDDLTWMEFDVVSQFARLANKRGALADELILQILGMPFLESIEETDIQGIRALSELGIRNQDLLYLALSGTLSETGITDQQTEVVTLLLMEQYDTEAANALKILPWIEDRITRYEQDNVIDLQMMAAESREVFWALMRSPWIRYLSKASQDVIQDFGYIATGDDRDGQSALQIAGMPFLESIEQTDSDVTRTLKRIHLKFPGGLPAFLSDPRLSQGITDASAGVVLLLGLEQENLEAGAALWAMPWAVDGITEDEVPVIGKLTNLAYTDLPLALAAAEYFNVQKGDLVSLVIYALTNLSGRRDASGQLKAQPWFADGINDAEAAFVVTLYSIATESPELYNDMLEVRYTQHRTISLPLAGDVNIWVIENALPPQDDDVLTIIEDTARITEEFLGLPFPTTDVILLLVEQNKKHYTVRSAHYGSHMQLNRFSGEVTNVTHETAHYYLYSNFEQAWLIEGGAEFIRAYVDDQKGIRDLTTRKSELLNVCSEYENIMHYNYIWEHIYQEILRVPGPGGCNYRMGERFLINVFETIGREAMSAALRELYLSNNEEHLWVGQPQQPPTEDDIYHGFLSHAPPDRKEVFRELYRTLHGGAVAFPDTDFLDDHADEAAAATGVAVGEVVEGALDYMFDFDYFRFHAEVGRKYRMNVNHDSLRYTSVAVYAPDRSTQDVLEWKSRRRVSSGPQILWMAPRSGEYYFAVQNFGGESGQYTLTITAVEDPPDDHGDTLATATGLSLGEVAGGIIEDDFDYDYFEFEAIEGRAYRTDVTSGTLEWFRRRLYASDGARPANWSWYGNHYDDHVGSRHRSIIEWVAPSSGQYYLAIDGHEENVGTYTVTITEIENEPGGQTRTACGQWMAEQGLPPQRYIRGLNDFVSASGRLKPLLHASYYIAESDLIIVTTPRCANETTVKLSSAVVGREVVCRAYPCPNGLPTGHKIE